ncbi:hypothetical protein GHT06_008646 [Daphnia sinensis]|uniref:Cytoplasmic dynein 2 heavy chain 1 n=1 Tax=Daphnia sinensis TaxID=1820382 RepID=A0AAD5LMS8_9CRUS|nr:hypothetical protein GHT06_008646 [Daphnia sinensis]
MLPVLQRSGWKFWLVTLDNDQNTMFNTNNVIFADKMEIELQNWKNISKNCQEVEERRQANACIRAIEPIVHEIRALETLRLREMEDSANSILGCVDDLWKLDGYKYPQDRMNHLLGISSSCFTEAIAKKLKNSSIWKLNSTEAHLHLSLALTACNVWINECHRMTSLFWKNDTYHPWKGDAFLPLAVVKLQDRLNHILSILQVIRLAGQLLPPSKQDLLDPNFLFESFHALDENPSPTSLLDNAAWKSAVTQFNDHFAQGEKEAGAALRPRLLSTSSGDPTTLLNSLLEFKELVQRPRIRRELESEGQALMNYTKTWLHKLRLDLASAKSKINSNSSSPMPDTLGEIKSIRQLEIQVSNIQKGVQIFADDMEEASSLDQEARNLLSEIQDQINDIFDDWSRNVLAGIRDESLSLSSDTPVMSFDEKKLMIINYDPRLVNFVEEVRLLTSMGFKMAPQIIRNAKLAEDFMQQAKDLEQIATFHNNIGDSMMPCLKPLMLEAAIGLSSLVQEQNVVTWSQADNVNSYIRRLQQAVQRLTALNQQLTMCHEKIQEKVLALFGINLLTQQQQWKDILREIRLLFGTVEAQGFHNSYAWRLYWDYQLYKAVECQYLLHLDELHLNVPDIHIELDFKKQNLQFKPAIEDIRREYYARLRKFLSLPIHFKGFLEQPGAPNIFPKIVENHSSRFSQVYAASGKIFKELEQFKEQFKICIAPALVDLDTLVEHELIEPQDWDLAFKAAKKKKEEMSNLSSDDERVGCFVISLAPLHREIEYIQRRYWDAITSSLYTSIHRDATAIDTFIANATLVLNVQFNDFEEVSQASSDFNGLLRTTPEMTHLMKKAEAKTEILSRWTQDNVEIFSQVCAKWENFNTLLSHHKQNMNKHMDSLKSNSQSQIMQFTSEIDQFQQRWQQEHLSDKIDFTNLDYHLKLLQKSRGEWNALMQNQKRLNANLEKVGEKPVELSVINDIEAEITRQEQIWNLYQSFNEELDEMSREEWLTSRNKIAKLDEFLETWMNRLLESKDQHPIIDWLKNQIEEYKAFIPALKLARGETFTDRHWAEFLKMAGLSLNGIEQIALCDLLQARTALLHNFNELKELNSRAAGESLVRQALAELEQWEVESHWTLAQHFDSNGIQLFIVKEFKELLNKVGENMSLIQSVKDSSYYQAYSDRIILWETRMTDLDFYLRLLSQIQLKWLYLEPVFNRGTLLKDAGRFRRLDADFRFIITEIKRDTRVTSLLRITNLRSLVTSLLDQVGRCQKSLFEFLEDKRSKFARFYFLGDEDLLDIVGQAASRPAVVQPHLKKLFAGIHNVLFSNDQRHIVAIASLEGERVELKTPISVESEPVEIWLNRLVSETRSTLQSMLRNCVHERQRDATDLSRFPTQILCLAEAIVFTERCEKAMIFSGGLSKLKSDYQNQLASYTSAPLLQSSGSDEQGVIVLKLQALIMDIIHYIDVIKQIIDARCCSITDWAWKKQLRFYLKNGVAVAQMASTEIEYTYEYQGNVAKLVHTPLTDKCYLTLTLALRMGLGGNPYGPAGTGKTESVKALGSLLGRQVLVFNCDEGLDVKSMGRIFVGLAKSGAWGCFDEFNRLDENTLSTVDINPHTGIFVTLNPAGKEYGGRQKLPDNLKLLFRPVVMSEPDIELIAEVILYSQGFRDAQTIGKKLVDIFRLAQKLLSRQQHYDWGLRALKSVLRTAGDALRTSLATGNSDDQVEYTTVVRALNFNTLSKLTTADSALFLGLVADVFPKAQQSNDVMHVQLVDVITNCCQEMGLMPLDRQLKKIFEVYEQAKQRMGVVIVGPPQTGKSTVCAILKKVLQHQKRKVQAYTMNPKAISRVHLLGLIDPATREWTDGVLTKIARLIVSESETTSWVVCDGDVDPEWIEALNSVLDDNRLLTMASGERIKFGPDVNFMFETHDLTYASPATISRMGVVYFSEDDMDFRIVVRSWLLEQPDEVQKSLHSLIEAYFYKAIDWLSKNGEAVVTVSTLTTIRGILSHLKFCKTKKQFVNGLLKGGGANLTAQSRTSFGQMILSMCGEKTPDVENPFLSTYDAKLDALVIPNPNELDSTLWNDEQKLLVPTINLQVAYQMIQPWFNNKEHVLVVGPEACGKSLLVEHCVRQIRSTRVVIFNCTASTTPQDVLHKLLQNSIIISSSNGQILVPREATLLILYMKDLNIVVPDKWGTCQLTAFLEQIINYKGCYDNNCEWLIMENIQLVCTLNLDHSQGRFQLSPRFISLLRVAAIGEPLLKELEMLTSCYLSASLKQEKALVAKPMLQKMTSFMVIFNGEMKRNLVPANNFQILFTTRHLTSWAENLARYEIRWDDTNAVIMTLGYEACRIYRDKLVTNEQRTQFDGLLNQLFNEEWKMSPLTPGGLLFTTCRSKKQGLVPVTLSEWDKIMRKTLEQYGRENEPLDIEMLPELQQTVVRADRVLSSADGRSLLLIGRSGVGRHTTIKLLSVMHHAQVMTPYPGRNYGRKQFMNDLKLAMHSAGVDDDLVYFVLEDHHFTDASFYAMIDSLLASGEVPGMYSAEESDALLAPLKELAADEGYSGSLFSFYAQRVRKRLRVIYVMDCAKTAYETIVGTHPSMYKYSDAIWMENWTKTSMMAVASRILLKDERAEKELEKSVQIYDSLDPSLKCPRRYVSFIQTFSSICGKKTQRISEQQERIQTGVSKLSEARELVAQLQAEAGQQEQLLAQKQMEAKAALQKITDTIQSAGVKRDEMQDLRSTIANENVALTTRKQAIDQELAEIEPLLMEARAAVSDIRNEALSEIRSLRAPPEVIRDILEGVLRLMGILDTSWTSMKSFLAKRGIKEDIRSFDARKISVDSRRAVEQLLNRRKESFDDKVAPAWVRANVSYSRVLERITPLEQEQANLRRNLEAAEDNMNRLATGLNDVDKQVALLRDQLSVSTREASEIEIGLKKARQTLSVSQNLVLELADEYDRWRLQLEELEQDRQNVAFHALLAAAFINFLSCSTEDERKNSLSRWLTQLKLSQHANITETGMNNEEVIFSLKNFLTSEQELMLWRSEGLAADDLAVDNALAITQGTLYPHILDASGKSIQWIIAHFKSMTVETTSQRDERFANILDLAIRFGKIIIIQDVDAIDPILFPILCNDYVIQGVRKLVRLGDKLVDWNDNFRLFLFSRSTGVTPMASPQANALVNTVNFNTTEAGLSEQLVALTVKHENPELEQRKKQLLEQEEQLKLQLAQLEEKLLQTLGNSRGNILENTDVLTSLRQLKQSSATIGQSLKESLALQYSLEKERSTYNELAQFASRLFFAIRELSKLNHCYQFSVQAFMQIFLKNLDSKNIENGPEKLGFIRQRLLKTVYTMVSRAVFKPDKMVAAAHIVREMCGHIFQPNEWELFVGQKYARTQSNQIQLPSWIDESRWPSVSALKVVFPSLFAALHLEDAALWTKSSTPIPPAIGQALSPFQQVLVVQAIYPEKLIDFLTQFLSRTLELTELFPATSSLRTILNETSAAEPVLVLLPGDGSGAYDMTVELEELARDTLGDNRLVEIAMGTDETEKATEFVRQAARNGHWICLKNVHLVTGWLPVLDRLINQLSGEESDDLHVDFRLWMTAEPVSTLPLSLLQRCKKIVSEAAQGMKRNLNRIMEAWNPSTLPGSSIHMQALFVLAWFHAVVQERRNYVPQGWLKKHEFNESDLRAATEVLGQAFGEIDDSGNRWEYVNGLLLNVIYGGRIDNSFDLRILRSYLAQYFNDDVLGKERFAINDEITIPYRKDYATIVRHLPETDKSSYFGLPPNIDTTVQYNQSVYLSARLKAFYQATAQPVTGDAKLLMNKLSPVFSTWKSLLQGTSFLTNKDLISSISENVQSSPLAAFVLAESALAVRLIHIVHQCLAAINRSLKSGLPLSVSLMESAIDISSLKTPKSWYALWEGPLQVEQFLRSLVKRARALTEEWLPSVQKRQLLTNVLDLSELMNPEAFFSVHRQHSARELGISMDSLQLLVLWDKPSLSKGQSRASAEITATLNGIHIQGARMTSGVGIDECYSDTPSWNLIPHCYLSWLPVDEVTSSRTNGLHTVKVPLYVDEERKRLITVLDIPFACGMTDDWYRAGIALSLKD